MTESKCSCCSCIDMLIINKKKIIGKAGIVLSLLNSLFITLDAYYPGTIAKYIVSGLISIGVFIGGIMFDRMAHENAKLNESCESLQNEKKEIIRRFTVIDMPTHTATPTETDRETNLSVEPINFEAMHNNNKLESFTFPS